VKEVASDEQREAEHLGRKAMIKEVQDA